MAKRKSAAARRAAADEEQQDVVRQNYLLKNGTTISVDDYDEDTHDIVEESDEEYLRRLASAPNARPSGLVHARTTIPNLHTYDSTQVPPADVPVIPPPGINTVIPDAKPVVTSDDPNTNLLDPTKRKASGAMEQPVVTHPEPDEDTDDSDTDDTDEDKDE